MHMPLLPNDALAFVARLPRSLGRLGSCLLLVALFVCAAVPALASEVAATGNDTAATETEQADEQERPAAAAVSPPIAERLLRANAYLEDNRLDDALAVVDEMARARKLKDVDRAQIHRFRGYILISMGKAEEAGREFEKALGQGGLDDAARQGMIYSLAQIHTQAGNYDRARALVDEWFQTAKDPRPEAFFLKAMILVQQDAYAEALGPARTAVERSAQPRESWLQLLAAVQFQLQDYAGVSETLRQLIAVAPGTKRYWTQLATIENTLGRDENALATLGVADVGGLLDQDKELRQRARLCFVRDLPLCCAETMEEGLASGRIRSDGEAWQLLANCRIAARETDKALEPLAKAGELSSDNKSFLLLGQIQLQKERFDDARAALQKARAKAKPEEKGSIELLLGIAELGSRRYDDAERSFRVALADEKTRQAADSYLKHLEQKRALEQLRDNRAVAGGEAGEPVSDAGSKKSESNL